MISSTPFSRLLKTDPGETDLVAREDDNPSGLVDYTFRCHLFRPPRSRVEPFYGVTTDNLLTQCEP